MKNINWKIWSKKLGINLFEIILAGGAVIYTGNIYWMALVPVIEGIRNAIKHW